jgi:glutathione-specific gamma-glutamylcyclotransferase
MRSIHHRGTVEAPGLVLALDPHPEAVCRGVAFRMPEGEEGGTLQYLRERELISSAYLEETHELALDDGRQVRALAYVVDTGHVQYCGGLDLETQARIIATAIGWARAECRLPLEHVAHLADLGIHDPDLVWLSARPALHFLKAPVGTPHGSPYRAANHNCVRTGPGWASPIARAHRTFRSRCARSSPC